MLSDQDRRRLKAERGASRASSPRLAGDLSYEEIVVESAVLSYVLRERPDGIEIPDLMRAMEARNLSSGEAVARAVQRLVDLDHLRMRGKLVVAPFASSPEQN